ncbi:MULTISPECIES: hypothetical protein [Cyanophyceae]|uniref:hypothetical protein n=1 Tax=Cyanophyceae TaxID=3028117 RepID=UPI00016DCDCE|nr:MULTISPECIES: hypothetical protein [Cyanophyceae]ACB00838.1 hypothetical protein SYNPCC7002_A2870 [Picosynechococcus sp. PCC 7002]SMH47571.1 hypothetical protein SAMN06272755_1794 [Picosynechococcus sp. OG1]SMQ81029.1 hypothetical protein SAMN06272774_1073 [Synechococcus sp. 7002]
MKITRHTIGKGLMLGTMILMGSSFSANAAPLSSTGPLPSVGCPSNLPQHHCWLRTTPTGPINPGMVATPLPSAQAQPKPLTCPEGWQPRPQEVNFQLGPCLPGTIVTPTPQPQAELLLPAIQKMHLGLPRR